MGNGLLLLEIEKSDLARAYGITADDSAGRRVTARRTILESARRFPRGNLGTLEGQIAT